MFASHSCFVLYINTSVFNASVIFSVILKGAVALQPACECKESAYNQDNYCVHTMLFELSLNQTVDMESFEIVCSQRQ